MKYIIVLLFLFMNVVTINSQSVLEQQRQKALNYANRFCDLLSQYSSEGELYVGNDSKIYDLCSSSNITAYDDLDGEKDDLLISYLFTILGKYDSKLSMTFSEPTISNIVEIPKFGELKASPSGELFMEVLDYEDVYIVIDVQQFIGALNKRTDRKIIYSCREGKIVSFLSKSGSNIAFHNALLSFSKREYGSVCQNVDRVVNSERFDIWAKRCASLIAFVSAVYSGNIDKAEKYVVNMPGFPGSQEYMLGALHSIRGDVRKSLFYFESAAEAGFEDACYHLGHLYSLPNTDFQDVRKGKMYLEKGLISKNKIVFNNSSFIYALMGLSYPDVYHLSDEKIIGFFLDPARDGFALSYIPLSIMYERIGQQIKASVWDKKAADVGSNVGKARWGYYLFSSSDSGKRSEGIRYLKEAAASDIDLEIKQLILKPSFPTSASQIQSLISKY